MDLEAPPLGPQTLISDVPRTFAFCPTQPIAQGPLRLPSRLPHRRRRAECVPRTHFVAVDGGSWRSDLRKPSGFSRGAWGSSPPFVHFGQKADRRTNLNLALTGRASCPDIPVCCVVNCRAVARDQSASFHLMPSAVMIAKPCSPGRRGSFPRTAGGSTSSTHLDRCERRRPVVLRSRAVLLPALDL
jgi:hypothetical protein